MKDDIIGDLDDFMSEVDVPLPEHFDDVVDLFVE
jgi:hypothetical protein